LFADFENCCLKGLAVAGGRKKEKNKQEFGQKEV
jgi:hypothetical protein